MVNPEAPHLSPTAAGAAASAVSAGVEGSASSSPPSAAVAVSSRGSFSRRQQRETEKNEADPSNNEVDVGGMVQQQQHQQQQQLERVSLKKGQRFSRMKKKGSAWLDAAFARHGMIVYDHAWKFIMGFALLSAVMSLGIFFRKNEYDMYKLYSYPGAPSHNVRQMLENTFSPQRFNYFFVSRSDDNILTKEGIEQVYKLVSAVKRLTVIKSEVLTDEYGMELDPAVHTAENLPEVITYEDLCIRDSWDDCKVLSVLELYSSDRQWGRPITTRDWPLAANIHTRKAFHLEGLLGDMRYFTVDNDEHKIHRVTGASACMMRFDLQGDAAVSPYSAALEKKIEQVAQAFNVPGFSLSYKLERSISDELMRSSSMGPAETVALVLAILTVLGYTVVVNTTTSYRTKTLPAIISVASTLLGYAGGAGFIYFCGVEHTPPADATPFLVLGIGVDNAFVLLNSYCLTFLHDTPRQRIISTARDAGVSITITTMTSVAALIIGAVCPFFSISKFSIVTAFCLAWSYVLAQTIFLGCLSLDARREAHQTRKLKEKAAATKAAAAAAAAAAAVAARGGGQREYHRQAAMAEDMSLPSQSSSEPAKSPQSLESNHGSDSLGSPISFQGMGGQKQENSYGRKNNGELVREQVQGGSPAAVAAAAASAAAAAAYISKEEHSVDIHSNSGEEQTSVESELLIALRKLSTYELASIMTFRMQHVWRRHREIVDRYVYPVTSHTQREEQRKQKTESKLNKLLRLLYWKRNKVELKKKHKEGEEEESEQQPIRGFSLEAGTTTQGDKSLSKKGEGGTEEMEKPVADDDDAPVAEQNAAERTLQHEDWRKKSFDEIGPRLLRMRLGKPSDGYMLMEEQKFLFTLDKYITEPKGNVGKMYRRLLGKYYCRLMGNKWVRRLIFLAFAVMVAVAIYGVTNMRTGITADEITPTDSHLIPFFDDRAKYFSSLGEEVTIFFPRKENWANRKVQERIISINRELKASGHALALYNGMAMFLEEKIDTLEEGTEADFYKKLHSWLQSDPVGRQFRTSFLWEKQGAGNPINDSSGGLRLAAWKFTFWLPHSLDADALLNWFKHTQKLLKDSKDLFESHAFTPLALLWESDPFTVKSTVNSLLSALLAIICMTVLLIPDLLSVLIVAFTVLLVDLCLFGYMTLWSLRLNLITMVNLLLAIGYSVDSTLFLLHAFTHGCGATRDARMTEGMLMMGCPVANGMLSTLLAVFYLVGTTKFVLIAFFRMMVLVLVLSFGFGMILLPAVLCIVGPLPPNAPVVSYEVVKPSERKLFNSPQHDAAAEYTNVLNNNNNNNNANNTYSPILKKSD